MQVEVSKISVLDLIKKIQNIKSLDDLADFIGSETKYISYYLYKCPDEKKYKVHQIPKKKGGFREISSPANGLKIIQRNLNSVLLKIYDEFITKSVHGFVLKKSIVSNASKHIHRRFLLNIDLKDFFPSVHFGRIKGLFQHEPFNLNDFSSTSLANLCCFKGVLPQGAPTSPILTNFVCYKLDKQLIKLATENKCKYTRYADDIIFSTNLKEFPLDVASLKFKEKDNKSMFENLYMKIDSILKIEKFKFSSQINGNTKDEISIEFKDNLCSEKIKVLKNLIFKSNCKMKQTSSNCILISNNIAETEVDLSDKFINIIASNGFQVNFNKVRMQTREYKQEVTGIKVNTKPNVERTYIRNIRAMLNCWSKFGLNKAQEIFFTKKATFKHPNKHQVNFQNVLFGRIDFVGQVRGKDDSIYLKLLKQYKVLNGEYVDEDKNENLEELRKSIIEECVHLISQNTEVIEKSFQLNKTQIENILDRLRFKVKLSKTSIKILAKHINQLKKVGNDRVTISDDEIDISSETINRIRLDIKTLFDLIKQNDIKFQKFDRELKDIKNEIDYNVETSINVTRIKDEVLKNKIGRAHV